MRQLRKEMKQETFTDIEYSFRKKKAKSRNNRKKLDYSFTPQKHGQKKQVILLQIYSIDLLRTDETILDRFGLLG